MMTQIPRDWAKWIRFAIAFRDVVISSGIGAINISQNAAKSRKIYSVKEEDLNMFSHITSQADKLRQLVFASDTAATYSKATSLTWAILKETGYLLWLVICIGLVLGEWIWKNSYTAGQSARNWVNSLESKESASPESSASMDQIFSDTGKKLLEVGKSSALKAVATAKDQLGIASEPAAPAPAVAPAKPAPAAAPAAPATPPVTPVASAPTTVASDADE
jgi:hypothetical protein